MKRAVISAVLLCALFTVSSCSKESEDKKVETKTTLITSSKWKYNDAGLDLDNNGVKDANIPPNILLSCDMDNTVTFKSDNTGVIDEGATKCETTAPQTVPFTWSLKEATNEITFSTPLFAGLNGDIKIVELSATKFTISKAVTVQGVPVPVTVIIFLTH